MEIYIKPAKKISITEKKQVYVKELADVVATADVAEKVKDIKLLDIKSDKKDKYLISVSDIVKEIKKKYPDYTVTNIGEMDTLVDYSPHKKKENKWLKWLKVAFVSIVLLAGSSTAIMSFHSDAQIYEIFQNYHEIFFGTKSETPYIIDIPYSIGLAVGIIVFFNHLAGKRITDDPTPIEVEMSLYETDIADTMIDVINTEKIRKEEHKGDDFNL